MQKLLTGEWRLDARFDKYDGWRSRCREQLCSRRVSVLLRSGDASPHSLACESACLQP